MLLTPSHKQTLQHEQGDVRVEHLNESHVHVVGLDQHPTHGGQQEEVEQGSHNLQNPSQFNIYPQIVDIFNIYTENNCKLMHQENA